MIKRIATRPFDVAAPLPGSKSVSSPDLQAGDDTGVFEQPVYRLSKTAGCNNPVLTRTDISSCDDAGASAQSVGIRGAAAFMGFMSSLGCAGQGDVEISIIALAWGLLTAGAFFGIPLGLNKLAGWMQRRKVVSDPAPSCADKGDEQLSTSTFSHIIDEGNWYLIERMLLNKDMDPSEIATMQKSLLKSSGRIPRHVQPRIYKAIVMADRDSSHAITAIDKLVEMGVHQEQVQFALADIMLAYEKMPNENVGDHIARVLIEYEVDHRRGVPDPILAHAVALTSDWEDCVWLVGILAIRMQFGYTQTSAHLDSAIGYLRLKPFGPDVYQRSLPPFLVGIKSVDLGN